MSGIMSGQEKQKRLDKGFRDDSNMLATRRQIREGRNVEAGLYTTHIIVPFSIQKIRLT